ncbi:MAG: hypothetical protein GX654_06130 [Desulfatiglans sp.]|jgi:hypothetical protein|nr:hypothetical protein [Desulfatiglans sp.]
MRINKKGSQYPKPLKSTTGLNLLAGRLNWKVKMMPPNAMIAEGRKQAEGV